MTASPPPLVEALPTRGGRVRRRLRAYPAIRRAPGWVLPALLTLAAAALRLVNLAHPASLAFDETYYVKDAWSLWSLGYEGSWAEGADEELARGDVSALRDTGAFVVHPPLGKWLIALGMAAASPGSSAGWRLATALLGSLTVLVVYLIARELTRSRTVAAVAGGLLAIDGLGIVMSRTALLDGILTFFLTLGVLFVLIDQRHTLARLRRPDPPEPPRPAPRWTGPVLWARPWLVAAGVAFGAASAVKWSGLYALAVFGLFTVATDALARRRAGIVLWPTDAVFRQGSVSFLLLVGPAALVYLASWTGWLVTDGGYGRGADGGALAALWQYHSSILGFHVGLSTSHPYASPAWQWPLLLRPTAFWVGGDPGACGTDHCIAVISSVPNPLIWYGGIAASLYGVYRVIRAVVLRQRVGREFALPLVGLLATYAPWLAVGERTIFQFYTIAMVPFLVIAIAVALREIAGGPAATPERRQAGRRVVAVYGAMTVLVSAFFYPVWTGMNVPYLFWLIHNWLPGWI